MKRFLSFAAIVALLSFPLRAADTNAFARFAGVQRVLFLGDSITHNGQYLANIEAYCLTRFPDRSLEFLNLGLSSETVSGLSETNHAGGRYPRPDLHERLGRVLEKVKPGLIFACYGMNDGLYQPLDPERFRRFREGMERLHGAAVAAGAKIIHVTPPVFDPVPIASKLTDDGLAGFRGPARDYNRVLDVYSEWLRSQRTNGWEVIDLHAAMNRWVAESRKRDPQFNFTPDGVHPDAAGHWFMAKQILLYLGAADVEKANTNVEMLPDHPHAEILKLVHSKQTYLRDAWLTHTGHRRPGVPAGLPLAEAQEKAAEIDKELRELLKATSPAKPFPGKKSAWEGFDRYDFEVGGKPAIVVSPKQALPGKPWIWRGEFFGAFARADVALVEKGFHLAYLRVPDLFGSPAAVDYWNAFYRELTGKHGLAGKPALIGLSRGGLYCYNWAIANPAKVACIYADAPVCDFKSWPGGKPKGLGQGAGSAKEWEKLLKAYGFAGDEEAIGYRGNPVDNLQPLAAAGVPLLHVYGDADAVVPWEENTGVIAERYRKLGGSITLISKPGGGHHPHGLEDPAPIVDFVVKHATVPQ